MQLSSNSHIPDGLLAANVLLSEKPHQGVPSWNLALHQGIDERNSTAAIGLRAGQHLNRAWSRYTGKERDTESGLDYFGARYFSGVVGRFMSPDWSEDPDAVPYADFDNPQTLNLYAYMGNNPLGGADPDGHDCSGSMITITIYGAEAGSFVHMGSSGPCIDMRGIVSGIANAASNAAHTVSQAAQQLHSIMNTPGGAGCLGSLMASGSAGGAAAGGLEGLAGLAGGGVGGVVTEPVGLAIGGVGGGLSGAALGMTVCPGGALKSSQGGGGGTKKWDITNPADKKVVGGKTYLKDGNTGNWWSRDTAGHGGSAWKVYEEGPSGTLNWIADADERGNYIVGKWKSDAGMTIKF